MAQMNKNWTKVLELYERTLGIPSFVIDYVAVFDIVSLVAFGVSSDKIAKNLDTDEEYVINTSLEFLGFSGWSNDLNFSPFYTYQLSGKDFDKYVTILNTITSNMAKEDIFNSFNACILYEKMEKDINEWYY